MVNLDSSIIPAIIIFIVLTVALNKLLFKPLMKVMAERESRTTGLMAQTQERLDNHLKCPDGRLSPAGKSSS
jgi:F0F1-type ATP synthase membrane subunit b/b'